MKVLFKAEGRRRITNESHGGNGLLTLHVITKPLNTTKPEIRVSKLHLVDLAGVDIYGNHTSLYKTVFELGGANTAKSQLEQFMLILCENNPEQIKVKYRLNPVIQYLGDSLDGRSIIRYIGHVRTDLDHFLITTSMFRFGQIVRGVKPMKLHNNIIENKEAKFELIQEQLQKSKVEKDLEVMMTSENLATNLNQDRVKHMQNVAEEYLQNKTNEIVLLNVTDATTVLQVFKNLYAKLENEKNEYMKAVFEKNPDDARLISKTESTLSATKGAKRPSKALKSKESLITGSRATSQTKSHKKSDRNSPSASLTQIKSEKKGDSPRASLRRSRTSSIIKKGGSRRKSATSTTSIGTDVNDQIFQEALPTSVPNQQEAWNEFTSDPECHYNQLMNNVEMCEAHAREIRVVYLEEVKKLQTLFDMIDVRKNELQRVQMQRFLNKEQYNAEGQLEVSETEIHCTENLKKAHGELVAQQEKVLKEQALYRIAIETYMHAKKGINEQFQAFCHQKYSTPMPAIDMEIFVQPEVAQEESLLSSIILDGKSQVEQAETSEEALHYEELKMLMKRQMAKTLKRKEAKRKWVLSSKI